MSVKESRRVFVIEQAIKGKITNRQAAEVGDDYTSPHVQLTIKIWKLAKMRE
ncbi:hypothetical protein [Neomoorella thermoacetica]|uniref:hypothetical protein n=1 Tax=Neomoorella thermoacetica TaxID=1525 RepID=UPI0004B0081D|nr:hypothetical protein [Moorella thermoacetica]